MWWCRFLWEEEEEKQEKWKCLFRSLFTLHYLEPRAPLRPVLQVSGPPPPHLQLPSSSSGFRWPPPPPEASDDPTTVHHTRVLLGVGRTVLRWTGYRRKSQARPSTGKLVAEGSLRFYQLHWVLESTFFWWTGCRKKSQVRPTSVGIRSGWIHLLVNWLPKVVSGSTNSSGDIGDGWLHFLLVTGFPKEVLGSTNLLLCTNWFLKEVLPSSTPWFIC